MDLDFSEEELKIEKNLSDALVEAIDNAIIKAERKRRTERYADRPKSLGAGSIGLPGTGYADVCERALFYEYKQYPKDEGFPGKLYRVFNMGHDAEDRIAAYIKQAGFKLLTISPKGKQFGFELLPDPETNTPRMRGFLDGVVVDGPPEIDGFKLSYPFLWECKALNNKKWKEMKSKGTIKSHPKYYAQTQVYMGVMNLMENPAMLTAMNRDTGELLFEFIPYNQSDAQSIIDRAKRVVTTQHPLELPRAADHYEQIPCKWCDFKSTCKAHESGEPPNHN